MMNTRDRLFKKRASLSFVVAAMLATPSRPSDLLVQLTDQQLHHLFDVAHVERRSRDPNHAWLRPATVDEWVAAFERKRDEIITHCCKS